MKAPKASKSRANDPQPNLPDLKLLSSSSDRQLPLKLSVEELRNPASKQSLRQHFTGAFPETHRVSSFDSSSSDMGIKDRLSRTNSSPTVGQNEAAGSSTSSVNSGTGAPPPQRLSTVQETNSKIDIEQAIYLLQELRKTASPQELVALHKALLPTRDSLQPPSPSGPFNDENANGSTSSLIRHRSLLPPGLATRSSPSEDLLRRQEDVPVVKKVKRSKLNLRSALKEVKEATSHSDLAALDLADERVDPRAPTPSDAGETSLGVYRYGTLRVTNGAASPVPSIAASIRILEETPIPPIPDRHRNPSTQRSSSDPRVSLDFVTAPNTPQEKSSMEFYNARGSMRDSSDLFDAAKLAQLRYSREHSDGERRPRERSRTSKSRDASVSGIPVPREVDESSPRVYRPTRPRRSRNSLQNNTAQSRDSSQHRPAHSRESSLSRIPLRVENSRHNLRVLEQQVSAQSLTPIKPDIDDGRVSPLPNDLPRFAQRWSHRASKISEDYNSDSELSGSSSYGDISTLRQYESRAALLKRLSTVYDGEGDDEDATAHETPEAALSKLNGSEMDRRVGLTLETHITSLNEGRSPPPRSGNSNSFDRPTALQKADSGYGTDSSFQARMKKSFDEQRKNRQLLPPDEGVSLEEDGMSLYSFNQILKSPSLLNGLATPSPPPTADNKKKRPSFLRLSSSKKGVSSVTLDPVSSDEAIASSPMDQKGFKQKKLQKPMPESVRKERKTQMKELREERRSSQAPETTASEILLEIPPVPTEVSNGSHQRFSFEPIPTPSATFDSTPIVVSPKELRGEAHHTTELNGEDDGFASADEAPTTPKLSLFRNRSKKRKDERPRSTIQVPCGANDFDDVSEERKTRRRSTGPANPKQSVFGVGPISCVSGAFGASNEDGNDDVIPLWSDHASVARTLGCGPYDLSTGMFKRSVALPSAVMHQIQAPHEITTNLSRSKTGGLRGMDSEMASELARLKSRDVAINKNEDVYDRPRVARPKGRRAKSGGEASARVPLMIEDKYPGHEENGETNVTPDLAELPVRSNSMYSESIPPMPELPANVQVRINRMDELAAKTTRHTAQPTVSVEVPKTTKHTAQPAPMAHVPKTVERPGDSTLSVAEAIRRAQLSQKSSESLRDEDGSKVPRTRPSGPRKKKSQRMQRREISSSGSDATIKDKQGSSEALQQVDKTSPAADSQQLGTSVWEQQAKHWREQRKSLEESLAKSKSEDNVTLQTRTTTTTTSSPSIVVSRFSTQSGLQTQTETQIETRSVIRQRKDSAALQADAYRALIGENHDTPSSDEREESEEYFNYSAATPVTMQRVSDQRPATVTVSPRSPISPLSPPALPIERARSPGGRVITPSGNYHPYTPADAAQAERSRAESLAKLTGTPISTSTEKAAGSKKPASKPSTPKHSTPSTPKQTTPKQPTPKSPAQPQKNAIEALFDRYSGGLEYSYERGVGVGGSAGMRGPKDKAGRKSKELSEGWGVDLSDVPMLSREGVQT